MSALIASGGHPSAAGNAWQRSQRRRSLLAAQLRQLLRQAGWPALAGIALLGGAAAIQLMMIEPIEQQIAAVHTKIAKARSQRNSAVPVTASDARSVVAALPNRESLEALIGAIHRAAADEGLSTTSAEYRARKEGDFIRVEIGVPLKTAWRPLRLWLSDLIAAQPALAVDDISLRRDNAESEPLAGRVQFTVFLRPGGDSGSGTDMAPLPERSDAVDATELFAARSWQPPPPPPPPEPKPVAPPLPFKYAGRLLEGQTIRIFLAQGNNTTLVKEGDRIGNYDVERLDKASVVLVYRPLQERQSIIFGADD